MSPENQGTDGGSGAAPEAANAQPENLTAGGANEQASAPKIEAVPSPAEAPRKSESKAEGKAKAKAKEEVQPVSTPKASEPKSLAQVMKVDLRRRRRPRY